MKQNLKDIFNKLKNEPRYKTDSILLIDGLNTFLRSFSLVNHINPSLNHIGGLTGFLKSIGYAIRIINPTYVIIVFDGVGSSNSKRNLFPGYKANRNPNRIINHAVFGENIEDEKEAIYNQMQRLMHYLQCLPVSIISIDATEADDIIGYLVKKFEVNDSVDEITIMSADKDFLQLVSNKTKIYSPSKKKIYKPADVLEEYNISSKNYILQKILLGDNSDNVPGIPGLGPKKMVKLFPEFSGNEEYNIDYIFKKAEIKLNENKLYAQLLSFKQQLLINNQLMNLKEISLSNENEIIVKEMAMKKGELNSYAFMSMYIMDKLGEAIPNAPSWLNEVFGQLDSL